MRTFIATKKRIARKDEAGFTLIEIIAVLVIMGILAAVAVPKFYDLQDKAMEKAISTAEAELKVRVNQTFADALLDGVTNSASITYAASIANNLGDEFEVTGWVEGDNTITYTINYRKEKDGKIMKTLSGRTIAKPIFFSTK